MIVSKYFPMLGFKVCWFQVWWNIVLRWTDRSISQITQCIRQIPKNAPFCKRNVHTCKHFHLAPIIEYARYQEEGTLFIHGGWLFVFRTKYYRGVYGKRKLEYYHSIPLCITNINYDNRLHLSMLFHVWFIQMSRIWLVGCHALLCIREWSLTSLCHYRLSCQNNSFWNETLIAKRTLSHWPFGDVLEVLNK